MLQRGYLQSSQPGMLQTESGTRSGEAARLGAICMFSAQTAQCCPRHSLWTTLNAATAILSEQIRIWGISTLYSASIGE